MITMIGKTADVTKFIEPDAGFTQSGKANEIPSKAALVNHWKPFAAAKTASRPIVKLVKNQANNNWMQQTVAITFTSVQTRNRISEFLPAFHHTY